MVITMVTIMYQVIQSILTILITITEDGIVGIDLTDGIVDIADTVHHMVQQ